MREKRHSGKFGLLLLCLCLAAVLLVLPSCGDKDCEHTFSDYVVLPGSEAGCTTAGKEARVCTKCGFAEERAIEALGHDWKDATCTEPKHCSRCAATEGEALGHDWQGATCTEPKHCSRCAATEGEALGHDWKDATCTGAKHCDRCQLTEGASADHRFVEEKVKPEALKTAATCSSAAVYYKSCSCGAISSDANDTFSFGQPSGAHRYTVSTARPEALKTAATCSSAAVYYKSCSCGAISSDANDTFFFGQPNGEHAYNVTEPTCGVGQVCRLCGALGLPETGKHTMQGDACAVCGRGIYVQMLLGQLRTMPAIRLENFCLTSESEVISIDLLEFYLTLGEDGKPYGYGQVQINNRMDDMKVTDEIHLDVLLKNDYLYVRKQRNMADTRQLSDGIQQQIDQDPTTYQMRYSLSDIQSYNERLTPSARALLQIVNALERFGPLYRNDVLPLLTRILTTNSEAVNSLARVAVNSMFTVAATEEGTVFTFSMEKAAAYILQLGDSTPETAFNDLFGEGAYEKIPGLLNLTVGEVLDIAESHGLYIADFLDLMEKLLALNPPKDNPDSDPGAAIATLKAALTTPEVRAVKIRELLPDGAEETLNALLAEYKNLTFFDMLERLIDRFLPSEGDQGVMPPAPEGDQNVPPTDNPPTDGEGDQNVPPTDIPPTDGEGDQNVPPTDNPPTDGEGDQGPSAGKVRAVVSQLLEILCSEEYISSSIRLNGSGEIAASVLTVNIPKNNYLPFALQLTFSFLYDDIPQADRYEEMAQATDGVLELLPLDTALAMIRHSLANIPDTTGSENNGEQEGNAPRYKDFRFDEASGTGILTFSQTTFGLEDTYLVKADTLLRFSLSSPLIFQAREDCENWTLFTLVYPYFRENRYTIYRVDDAHPEGVLLPEEEMRALLEKFFPPTPSAGPDFFYCHFLVNTTTQEINLTFTFEDSGEENTLTKHTYKEETEKAVIPENCLTIGERHWVCETCGHEKIEYYRLPHKFDSYAYQFDNDENCEHGVTITYSCSVCGTILDKTHENRHNPLPHPISLPGDACADHEICEMRCPCGQVHHIVSTLPWDSTEHFGNDTIVVIYRCGECGLALEEKRTRTETAPCRYTEEVSYRIGKASPSESGFTFEWNEPIAVLEYSYIQHKGPLFVSLEEGCESCDDGCITVCGACNEQIGQDAPSYPGDPRHTVGRLILVSDLPGGGYIYADACACRSILRGIYAEGAAETSSFQVENGSGVYYDVFTFRGEETPDVVHYLLIMDKDARTLTLCPGYVPAEAENTLGKYDAQNATVFYFAE